MGEQFTVAAMLQIVRIVAGGSWSPPAFRTESPASDWVLRAEGLANGRASFGGPVTAIAVPYDLLDLRLPREVPTETSGEELTSAARDFAGSLQQAVASLADAVPLSFELGAEIAETSLRTLRRRLAGEGTSFRQIRPRPLRGLREADAGAVAGPSRRSQPSSATPTRPTSRAPSTAGRGKPRAPIAGADSCR